MPDAFVEDLVEVVIDGYLGLGEASIRREPDGSYRFALDKDRAQEELERIRRELPVGWVVLPIGESENVIVSRQ